MTRPAPYPEDTRCRGWRLEIDHERFRQSDTWALASPELRPWLLMLAMVAWEQTPCGSMPSEDDLISARIGMPPKAFAKHKAILLRKWWLADDGRLYHSVLVQRVMEMLDYRRKTAERVAKFKLAKCEQRSANALLTGEQRVENGTGTGTGIKTKPLSAAPTANEGFAKFWEAWPKSTRKVGKDQCAAKWRAKGCEDIASQVLEALEAFKRCDEWAKDSGQFVPAPLVWLNQSRWEASAALAADRQTEGFI